MGQLRCRLTSRGPDSSSLSNLERKWGGWHLTSGSDFFSQGENSQEATGLRAFPAGANCLLLNWLGWFLAMGATKLSHSLAQETRLVQNRPGAPTCLTCKYCNSGSGVRRGWPASLTASLPSPSNCLLPIFSSPASSPPASFQYILHKSGCGNFQHTCWY